MIRLLLFLKKIAPFILFLILELIAFSIYYSQNSYQRAKMVSISNFLTGGIHSQLAGVSAYFDLDGQNQELLRENVRLHQEIDKLRLAVDSTTLDSLVFDGEVFADFKVVKVVNNTYTRMNNYITISAGLNQGIKEQMALFNAEGIVGYVEYCSDNYSVAVSLLNRRDFRTSGKIKGTSSLGSINWDGASFKQVVMDEIPMHAKIKSGDTIVTTEYSNIFPAEIPIGVVDSISKVSDVLQKATLWTMADMSSLSYLYAVELPRRDERKELEDKINQQE